MADLRKCDGCGKTAPQSKYGPDITEDGWYRLIGTAPKGEYAPKWWACCVHCLCVLVFSLYNTAAEVEAREPRLRLDDEASMTGDSPREVRRG